MEASLDLAAPHVRRTKPIIAMTWATDDYAEAADSAAATFKQFGLEYIRNNDPINKDDAAGIKMWKNWPGYYITRDRIVVEFLQSCKGLYERVLVVNSDVHMHNPLLPQWLDGPSVFWRYSCVYAFYTNNGNLRDITIDLQILKPEDLDLYSTAIEMSKKSPYGYDIEFTLSKAIQQTKKPVQFEYIRTKRYIKYHEMVPQSNQGFTFTQPEPRTFVNANGQIYYQHLLDNLTASYDCYEPDTIFSVISIDDKKLNRYVLSENLVSYGSAHDLILSVPKTNTELARSIENWLNDYPASNDTLPGMLAMAARTGVSFHQHCILGEDCPEHLLRFNWISKFSNKLLYEIDGWILCPELGLVAPLSIWRRKPFYLHLPHNEIFRKLLLADKIFPGDVRSIGK